MEGKCWEQEMCALKNLCAVCQHSVAAGSSLQQSWCAHSLAGAAETGRVDGINIYMAQDRFSLLFAT